MKKIVLLLIIGLSSCSQEPEDNSTDQLPRQDGVLGGGQNEKSVQKKKSPNNALKGYQENIQRAKDMEKEVLKQAERQRKIIDG